MTSCYVIGNGPSRKGIDLTKLQYPTWGCNALYRDFSPNYLVAVDKEMQDDIVSSGYTGQCYFRKHRDYNLSNITYFPSLKPNNSGIAAIRLAMRAGYRDIHLLGFDLDINKNDPNIYNGTKHYTHVPKLPKDVVAKLEYWAKHNPQVKFTRYNSPNTIEGIYESSFNQ